MNTKHVDTLDRVARAVDYIKGRAGTRELLPSEARRLMMAAQLLEHAARDLRKDAPDDR